MSRRTAIRQLYRLARREQLPLLSLNELDCIASLMSSRVSQLICCNRVSLPDGYVEVQLGRKARLDGKPREANPYPEYSFASYDWTIGWLQASDP